MNTKLMRKVCLLCLGAVVMFFSVNASAQEARVTLNESNVSLKSVIEKIESQTRYLFAVEESVDVNQTVTVLVDNASLATALDQIVSGHNLAYSINGMNIVLARKSDARPMTVKGQIKDPSGLPVPGASVFILGTTIGTVTDLDGNFALDIPAEHVGGGQATGQQSRLRDHRAPYQRTGKLQSDSKGVFHRTRPVSCDSSRHQEV